MAKLSAWEKSQGTLSTKEFLYKSNGSMGRNNNPLGQMVEARPYGIQRYLKFNEMQFLQVTEKEALKSENNNYRHSLLSTDTLVNIFDIISTHQL